LIERGLFFNSTCENALSGTAPALEADTAAGNAEPVVANVFVEAEGLGEAVLKVPAVPEEVTTGLFKFEPVVWVPGASAERT
jgi:hypothetical protein